MKTDATTGTRQVVLKGGACDGVRVTALLDPHDRVIDRLGHNGYAYRDSGHVVDGLQVYAWLPGTVQR
jgi:hypothetical protein